MIMRMNTRNIVPRVAYVPCLCLRLRPIFYSVLPQVDFVTRLKILFLASGIWKATISLTKLDQSFHFSVKIVRL